MDLPNLALMLQRWLDDEHVKWEARDDVVTWAEAYGSDCARAWQECTRADQLMAIAGATGASTAQVKAVACDATRAVLRFVPKAEQRPSKALRFAVTYRPTARRELDKPLLEAQRISFEPLIAQLERKEKALLEKQQALGHDVRGAFVKHAAELIPRASPEQARAVSLETIGALLEDRAIKELWTVVRQHRRLMAQAYAVYAARSLLVVATSAAVAAKARQMGASLAHGGKSSTESQGVLESLELAHRSHARVFTETALLFDHAANAFGSEATASESVWQKAVAQQLTALVQAYATQQMSKRNVINECLERAQAEAAAEKHAELAQAVRAQVAFAPATPRLMLRGSIAALEPIIGLFAHGEVLDAQALALAVLDAPGPLDQHRLARALSTLHERVLATLETQRDDSPEFKQLITTVTAAFDDIREVLANEPDTPAN